MSSIGQLKSGLKYIFVQDSWTFKSAYIYVWNVYFRCNERNIGDLLSFKLKLQPASPYYLKSKIVLLFSNIEQKSNFNE